MEEISSSGSGEGPGWVTARPTLQSPFGATPPAALAPRRGTAAPRVLACSPRPPARPAARRCAGALVWTGQVPLLGGWGAFRGDSTRISKGGILHAQRDERHF